MSSLHDVLPNNDGSLGHNAITVDTSSQGRGTYETLDNIPGNLAAEKRFLKGAAISVWQNSPCETSQWTAFARRPHGLLERLRGKSQQLKIDISPDFWNRYRDDISCARALGSNSIRLSLEWSRVMPYGPGELDETAVQRYREILDECAAAGLEPMVTLHHFVHPDWFERLGGFEREENIRYFEDWAVTAFKLFRSHGVTLIATFNEPTCAAFTGHIAGVHAPGRRGAVAAAGRVLLNMLRAHGSAYRAIRAQPGGQDIRVGLVHQKIRFEAEDPGPLHCFARWTADWLTHCFGWDVVHEYLLTGRFVWRLLGRRGAAAQMVVTDPAGRPPCDWLGINYYTRVVLDWRLRFTCRRGEVLTDMGWPVVPEGLYDAIAHSAQLGVPLYVTETGIADGQDDRRGPLIAAYWEQVGRAVADGYDVRGFYYWTLCDNFEWHLGYNMKFGLFEWTEAPAHPRANPAATAAATAATAAATVANTVAAAAASTAANTALHHHHHHRQHVHNHHHHQHDEHGRTHHPQRPPDGASSAGCAKQAGSDSLASFTLGPSAVATVTATIVSVSQPSSPRIGRRYVAGLGDAQRTSATGAVPLETPAATAAACTGRAGLQIAVSAEVGGGPFEGSGNGGSVLSPSSALAVEQAVAEAAEAATRWSGRRLRLGSLELVRRYAATPDGLAAAHLSLTRTIWPPLPLPAALRRGSPSDEGGGAGGGAGGSSGLAAAVVTASRGALRLSVVVAVAKVSVAAAGAAWSMVRQGVAVVGGKGRGGEEVQVLVSRTGPRSHES